MLLFVTIPRLWDLGKDNFELVLLLLFSFIINFYALYYGVKLLRFYLFPPVIGISILNFISFYLSIIFVPFDQLQCGPFNQDALYFINLSNLIFYLVYFWISNRYKNEKSSRIHVRFTTRNGLLWGSFFLFLLSLTPIPISDISNTCQYLSVAFLLYVHYQYKSTFFINLLLVSLLIFLLIKAVLSTLVFSIVYLYFFCFVIFLIKGLRQTQRRIEFYVLSTVIGLFVFFFSAIKSDLRKVSDTSPSKTNVVEDVATIFSRINASRNDEIADHKYSVLWRLSYTASALSHVMEETPANIPFWNGVSYLPIIYKFIPRILWPQKPKESMGQDFGHQYKLLSDDNYTTSMNAPIIVEAYFNYGLFGVVLVSIFMGILVSLWSLKFNLKKFNSKDVISVFVVAFSSLYSIQWESNLSMYVGKLVIIYILVKLIDVLKNKESVL